MKENISNYKNSMIDIFEKKYNVTEIKARKWIKDYEFDKVLKMCNYIALHDDPETWVDEIYQWINEENELKEM